jgi:AcrR family transcriptional regulator
MPDRKTRSLKAALDEAIKQFSSRSYEDVSVNEIAAAAQCSTTTIYDVYGNKMGLYIAATQAFVSEAWTHIDSQAGHATPLGRLTQHLEARAARYADPSFREMTRNIIARISIENFEATPSMRAKLIEHYIQQMDMIKECIDAGALRALPAHYVTDVIFAHIGWRPLFHGLILGSKDPMNFAPEELAWRSVLPFLTAKGAQEYRALRPALTELMDSAG